MGVVNTTYTFSGTDTITSSKLNNIIDDTTFTSDAIQGATLQVVSPGKLAVSAGGITSNELASGAVTTNALADGAVTQAKASNMLLPAGAIMAFAMNGAPTGWLAANGSAVSRTLYAALFAAIGITYGAGDGSTTFALPDLRGYFVRGSGTNSDGTVAGTFGAKQAQSTQDHKHRTAIGFDNNSFYGWGDGSYNPFFGSEVLIGNRITVGGSAAGGAAMRVAKTDFITDASGEIRPANIAMLYCIKI
jgi:hypothetical protein